MHEIIIIGIGTIALGLLAVYAIWARREITALHEECEEITDRLVSRAKERKELEARLSVYESGKEGKRIKELEAEVNLLRTSLDNRLRADQAWGKAQSAAPFSWPALGLGQRSLLPDPIAMLNQHVEGKFAELDRRLGALEKREVSHE